MRLPTDVRRWTPEALEEWRERSALVWEGDRASTEAEWEAAKAAAERIVRARWAAGLSREERKGRGGGSAVFLRYGVASGR